MAARLRPGKAAGRGVSRARRMPSEPVLLASSSRALPPALPSWLPPIQAKFRERKPQEVQGPQGARLQRLPSRDAPVALISARSSHAGGPQGSCSAPPG